MANPFTLEFEELAPLFGVTGPGGNGLCAVYEGPAPSPFPDTTPTPITSIRLDQNWGVTFRWRTTGPLNFLMAGTWQLAVYLEEMGGGEFSLPGNTTVIPFVSAPTPYNHVFNFGAGVVTREGAYRVVTTVDMSGPGGYQGPISGVGEGPIVKFYEVGP